MQSEVALLGLRVAREAFLRQERANLTPEVPHCRVAGGGRNGNAENQWGQSDRRDYLGERLDQM